MFYAWRKLKLCDGMKALTRCALKCNSVYQAQMILEYLFTSDVVGRQIDHRIQAQIGLAHRMPYFSVLGILKYGIGWRPQNAPFENCSI